MPGGITPPLSVIKGWPHPNHINPELRSNALLIVTIVLAVLAVVVVALRLYCRLCLTRNAGADDWMLLAGMAPAIGFAVAVAIGTEHYGFRNHVWDVDLLVLINARKVTFAIEVLYLFASVSIKLSILLFYLRLAKGILPRGFIHATWAMGIFVVAYWITTVVSLFLTCRPLASFWWRISPIWRLENHYACYNEGAGILSVSSISALQDFLIALLPTLVFARLPMPMRQKVALGVVFGIGIFLCVAGVMRVVYVKEVFYDTYDATWTLYLVWLWMIIEVLLGPVVASAPALRVLFFHYVRPRLGSYYTGSHEMGSHADEFGNTLATDASHSRNRDSMRESAHVLPEEEDYPPSEPSPAVTVSPKTDAPDDGWYHTMPNSGIPDRRSYVEKFQRP